MDHGCILLHNVPMIIKSLPLLICLVDAKCLCFFALCSCLQIL